MSWLHVPIGACTKLRVGDDNASEGVFFCCLGRTHVPVTYLRE